MPQFIIERDMPGVGTLTPAQLKAASETSCATLHQLGPQVQWVHSYVTANQIFCIYRATTAGLVLEHARLAGFPASRVSEISTVIDPLTAEREIGT